jgi:hypothetical protein
LDTIWSEQYFFDLYLQRLQGLIEYTISSDQKKSMLIKEWEHKYSIKWLTYNVEEKEGMSKVKPMTAHHIIPREAGGINEWWNIAPLSVGQHMIIHQCSAEEKACFSQDFAEREFFRIFLKIKTLYPTSERYESSRMTLEKVLSKRSRKEIHKTQHHEQSGRSIVKREDSVADYQNDGVIHLLVQAIINNEKEYVKKTIKQGIDINSKNNEGDTLLIIAVKNKRKTIAR